MQREGATMISRRAFVRLGAAAGAGMFLPVGALEKAFAFNLLGQAPPADPLRLKKYVDHLPIMPVMPADSANSYQVGAFPVLTRVHRQMKPTKAWGYRPMGWKPGAAESTWLGPTFVARKDVPIQVQWFNELKSGDGMPIPHRLPVDPSLHWAAPFGDNMKAGPFPVSGGSSTFSYTLPAVPLVPHVHGAEVEPNSDGGPDSWFTPDWAQTGPAWAHKTYHYANGQSEATLWYHDHALGLTRLNVYMGLAGAYVLRDPAHAPKGLPSGVDHHGVPLDIPLVIQDRLFDDQGQLFFPAISDNPDVHPFWAPEFFGDTITVNGRAWPHLDVEPRAYRFRILNGSNARMYQLWLGQPGHPDHLGPAMHQIATDGGYLYRPVRIDPRRTAKNPGRLFIAPGERCEVVIDFSAYAGHRVRLYNDGIAPHPMGDPVDPRTTGQIMQFHVREMPPKHYTFPKNPLNPSLKNFPTLKTSDVTRTRVLTLNEIESPAGPLEVVLNLTKWMAPVSEKPVLGSTEKWVIVNTTADTHPIHLHLVQFQLLSRRDYDDEAYDVAFKAANGTQAFDGMAPNDSGHMAYTPVDPTPYLRDVPRFARPEERGWKDTLKMYPGEVTTILVRFSPVDGGEEYPFDATAQPGYVWHCHIIDHEDNEMMRPYGLVEHEDA